MLATTPSICDDTSASNPSAVKGTARRTSQTPRSVTPTIRPTMITIKTPIGTVLTMVWNMATHSFQPVEASTGAAVPDCVASAAVEAVSTGDTGTDGPAFVQRQPEGVTRRFVAMICCSIHSVQYLCYPAATDRSER